MKNYGYWLLAIILLGLALRLYKLGDLPNGMHPDEAHYALDAVAIRDGWRPVFLERNNGREPLFVYFMAGLFALIGPTVWSARLAGAIVGTLMIPAQYLLVSRLPLPHPRETGLLSAALVAFTFWPVSQSHQALRAGLFPVWAALIFWAWWETLRGERRLDDISSRSNPGAPVGYAIRRRLDDISSRSEKSAPVGYAIRRRLDDISSRSEESAPVGYAIRRRLDNISSRSNPGAPVGYAIRRRLDVLSSRSKGAYAALTGVLLAAALWTHLSARLLPFVLVGAAVWAAWRTRRREPLLYLALALGLASILVLPLAVYFVENPSMMGLRTNQVSVLNPEVNQGHLLGTLLDHAWRIALMVNVRGTTSWLENLRGRPVFDPLVGLAFLAGLGLMVRDLAGRRGWSPHLAAVLLGLGGLAMLAPSWLSAGAPSYGRLNGVWSVIFLLPAWGLERALSWFADRGRARLGTVTVCLILCISAAWSAWDFFVVYANAPDVYRVYFGPSLERGRQISQLVAEGPTYVSPAAWNQAVIRFTNVQNAPPTFEPRLGLILPLTGEARYAFDPVDAKLADEFNAQWPRLRREELRNSVDQVSLIVFRLAQADMPTPATATPTTPTFNGKIRLTGYTLPPTISRGKPLALTLVWETLAPTEVDHNLFIRVVSATGKEVGPYDGPPLGGLYPTNLWRPGERILQRYEIPIAKDAPLGQATLRLGWYNWRNGERLPVAGDEDAAIEVGRLEIRD